MIVKGQVFDKMLRISEYFKRNAEENRLFRPELVTSERINGHIIQLDNMNMTDALHVVELFNSLNYLDHYDGTGWLDYGMHLLHLLKQNGFPAELNPNRVMHLTEL